MKPQHMFALLIFILVLDVMWLTISRTGYQQLVQRVQTSPLTIKYVPAIASYACVFIGIIWFAIPLIEMKVGKQKEASLITACLLYGGGLGLVIYGVFNFTNMAIFKNYDVIMAMKDTLWGVTLFTISTLFYFKALR